MLILIFLLFFLSFGEDEKNTSKCDKCKASVEKLRKYLTDKIINKLENETVEKVCSKLPDFVQKACISAITNECKHIIKKIDKKYDPETVCKKKVCYLKFLSIFHLYNIYL